MQRTRFLRPVLLSALTLNICQSAPRLHAEDAAGNAESSSDVPPSQSPFNITMKTLGGRQLWGDVLFFHDWRIQHSVLDDHYRLLDGNDVRHAWGSYDDCCQRLEEIRKERAIEPMSGKAVILVHGIIRSSKSFDPMKARLKQSGYQVFGFDYPSTRVDIPSSAKYLRRCVESLEGIEEINFVVHSMGGLVVRASLEEGHDPRMHRMVMLGVPNLGAHMANLMQKNFFYRTLYGPAGQQLVKDTEGLIARLPTPDFEFALISGARGTPNGYNPLVPGDDDGTVALESTKLPGACDLLTVNSMHSFMMNDAQVIDCTERFLQTGALRESGEKEPVPRPTAQTTSTASTSPQSAAP